MIKSSYFFKDLKKLCCSFCSVHGMMLKSRLGMVKRNAVEVAQLECLQMLKITHLKEAEVADSGESRGDHMATHIPEGQKRHGLIDIHEKFV